MADNEQKPSERSIADPLSETTRKERRALLAVSGISYAVAVGDFVPKEISTIGITLTVGQQQTVLYLLVLLNAYFLWAFISYARADLTAWEADRRDFKWVRARIVVTELEEELRSKFPDRDEQERQTVEDWERSRRAYDRRRFVEFFVPIVIAFETIVITGASAIFWRH